MVYHNVIYFCESASNRQLAKVAMEDMGILDWSLRNCLVANNEPWDTSAMCCGVPGILRSAGFSRTMVVLRGE